jgi:beta-barrel assembly-enhancing protease
MLACAALSRGRRKIIIETMRFLLRLSLVAVVAALNMTTLHAGDLPELGSSAAADLSPQEEKAIGQKIMNQIRWQEPTYLEDPEIEDYLNQLGGRLAAASPDPGIGFTFFAIKDPTINAFAMFGGYVGVHTGLITATQSESELAGVLAHEISHVTQHHLARQIAQEKQLSMLSLAAMAAALLAAHSNGSMATATIVSAQAGAIQAQLAFSRDYEREADRVGFQTLEKAGFDVHGMSAFFERLQRATRTYDGNAPVYLRTHPLTTERISDMQNREQEVPYRQVPDSFAFQLVRAKVRALRGTPREAIADLRVAVREGKAASPLAARYGLAVALSRNKDWAGADREIAELRKAGAVSPMIESLAAQARIAQNDPAGGLRIYRDALSLYPQAHALIYGYGEALLAQSHIDQGVRFAEDQLQLYPQDPRLYQIYARLLAAQGRVAAQQRALAEVSMLQGNTTEAVQHLEIAQKAGDADFFEQSKIDARLRELRKQQQDEKRDK